ncbi:MAG: hypothetical protein ACU0CI_02745 [Shimia sp.]
MFSPDFLERLRISPVMPEVISRIRIEIRFHAGSHERRVPERVFEELTEAAEDISPLLAAGFAARAVGIDLRPRFDVVTMDDGVSLRLEGAEHRAMLAFMLMRLVECLSITPPGAYERLLALTGGDDAEATAAFSPKLVTDIAEIVCTIEGHGNGGPTDLSGPHMPADIAELSRRIERAGRAFSLSLPSPTTLPEDIEHGFLVLQNAGVFAHGDVNGAEPELFMSDATTLAVEDHMDAGFGLAELAWLLTRGAVSAIEVTDGA